MRMPAIMVVFGLFWALTIGCSNSSSTPTNPALSLAEKEKQAILRILHADKQLMKERESLPPKSTPSQIAWAVGRYCDALERIDMSDCPADFRVAYRHHRQAWREAKTAIERLPDGFFEGVFMGAMNSLLRGELDGGASRLEGEVKRGLERVRDTWIEVEKIGARYGAAL